MSILVVGSVALDSIETPVGRVDDALGGSAVHFSIAANFFYGDIRLVGIIGDDFPIEHIDFLKSRGIDLEGLEKISGGKTFRWGGSYLTDLNAAETHFTDLNVFGDFDPKLPDHFKNSDYVLLANIDPKLQLSVLDQISKPKLVVCDTMNLWISIARNPLLEVLKRVDFLILNDGEAKMLTGEENLIRAGRKILTLGPKRVVIKKGEHGAISLTDSTIFATPAFPIETVVDPTGAGDGFAGGFLGTIASAGTIDEKTVRKAIISGTVIASYNVEDFSLNRLRSLTKSEVEDRSDQFFEMINCQ